MRNLTFFLRLFVWFGMRSMRAHPWRVFAVLLGIALGAGVFTSVRLAVHASLTSFEKSLDVLSGKADRVVVQPGGRVPERLVALLKAHPAVEAASPLTTVYVQSGGENKETLLLIGLDPILDHSLRNWRIASDRGSPAQPWLELVRTPYSILPSRPLARAQSLEVGERMRLEHVQQIQDFRIVGLLEPEGLALLEGGFSALVDIATMQEFTGTQGFVDRIDVRLKPWAKKNHLEQLQEILPAGVLLESPSQVKETGQAMIAAYQLNLTLLSFVSLFVGMFLVYSLVSLNAASRRRELAILRSLGASSRMVLSLILCEGLVLGVLGWMLAVPIGSFLVRHLVQDVSNTISDLFVRVHVQGVQLDSWEILLSFGMTLAICTFAAGRPAYEATRIAPREALFMQGAETPKGHTGRRTLFLGLTAILLAWPISRLPNLPGIPVSGYAAVFVLVAGFALLAPAVLRWMGAYLPPLLRRMANEAAYLGGRYVRDAGPRTAIAVGALITATALFVALTIMVHSFRHTVTLWVHQTIAGDLFLRPKMAGFNQYRDPLPSPVVKPLQGLPEDVQILPYRRIFLKYGDIPYQLEATEIELFLKYGSFILLEGDLEEIAEPLIAGRGVLVSEVFSNKTGLGVGQRFRLNLGPAALDVPILGVFRDYRTQGGVVYTALKPFQQLTGDRQWSGALFFFKDRNQDLEAAAARLRERILRCCGRVHPLEMASGTELRREILRIFDETFAVTTVLLLIALIVAGLGITTSLTALVLERIRQLNTLSAIGSSPGQIRTMILWEAVFMVAAGETLGVLCGFLLSDFLIDVINLHAFGWTFLYSVDWQSLLISLPLILITALVAALPAARLVIRSSPALALKEY